MRTSFRKSKQNHSLEKKIFAIYIYFYPGYTKNFYNNYYYYKKTDNPIKKKLVRHTNRHFRKGNVQWLKTA